MSSGYAFYDESQGKFKKGDLILISFGTPAPSTFQVLSTRGKKLIVLVMEDTYDKDPLKSGTVCDISKAIYEGYWAYRKVSPVRSKKTPVQVLNP